MVFINMIMKHTYTNEEYNNWDEYMKIVMKWRRNTVSYPIYEWRK